MLFSSYIHRALKEAALAQRVKEKAKKKGGFFGFGGKAVTKEEEEVDAEQDHDDKEEVREIVFVSVVTDVGCGLWLVVCVRVFVCFVRCCVCVVYSYFVCEKMIDTTDTVTFPFLLSTLNFTYCSTLLFPYIHYRSTRFR